MGGWKGGGIGWDQVVERESSKSRLGNVERLGGQSSSTTSGQRVGSVDSGGRMDRMSKNVETSSSSTHLYCESIYI